MTSLERPARDKHPSLLGLLVNYVCKMFINIGLGNRGLREGPNIVTN